MPEKRYRGYATAIAGGVGLGLLLGSEFPGTYATLAGAAITLLAIGSMVLFSSRAPQTG
ncbi:hypothetical protein [Methanovulcanius yangii]|uniref:hypothetical protein n=1 Tax=Methanovulcanius yangii TaxID=1789227 RepID=UPI0029C9E7F8|nr:hypothetical protein [Methanovulcanius yangii]